MKPWIKWLIWFFLLGNLVDRNECWGVSLGMIKRIPHKITEVDIGFYTVWFILSAIAFTYYTMKIKEL